MTRALQPQLPPRPLTLQRWQWVLKPWPHPPPRLPQQPPRPNCLPRMQPLLLWPRPSQLMPQPHRCFRLLPLHPRPRLPQRPPRPSRLPTKQHLLR